MDFWQGIFTDKSVIGSIIGGLIGGFFTYLAVLWTFRNQSKNEYPKKLFTLSQINFAIQDYEASLKRFEDSIVFHNDDKITVADLNTFKEQLILYAVNVDKTTYRIIRDAFSKYKNLKYEEITDFGDIPYAFDPSKAMDAAAGLMNDLPKLRLEIGARMRFYEDRIK